MYILIDRAALTVLYRCEKIETIRSLTHIELPYYCVSIQEECCLGAFHMYSSQNLRDIFKNLTGGTDPHSHNKEYLAGQISRLCQTITPTDVEPFEVMVQSMQIKNRDKKCYRYVKGSSQPLEVDEQYDPPPLVGDWNAAQALPAPVRIYNGTSARPTAPAPVAKPWGVQQTTEPPKYAPPWA